MDRFLWWSGLFLLLGGGLATLAWLLFALLDPGHANTFGNQWWVLNGLAIAGGLFMGLGLPGLYVAQAERGGWLALLAMVILFIGIVLAYVGVQSVETATAPNVPASMMRLVGVAAPSAFVGGLLMALVLWRAGVFPLWTAVVLLLAILLGLLAEFVPLPQLVARNLISVPFTAVLAALGWLLMALRS